MKNSRHVGAAVLFAALVFVFAAGTALAQDPVKVAPNNFKVLLDNDRVRVLEFRSKGEKIPMHSHPDCLIYNFVTGKTKYTSPDGKTTERDSKAGDVAWRDAETHASQYLGTGDAHALLVEFKAKPHKMAPAKKM
jgi:hypothetical protein